MSTQRNKAGHPIDNPAAAVNQSAPNVLQTAMKGIGLALSGGGFRATLYHIGLARFLRDAGLLSKVSHITAVSGGSIFAAHLGLNWGRYTGSAAEFDAAAAELLTFIRLDVRNRILRRYPFAVAARWPRRLMGLSNRKASRTGLLEDHYRQFLLGDTSLFQLPVWPQVHLLATNLSEGCLCSFNREGLWMIGRDSGHALRVARNPIGLATIPMAVAASSAFPGFFPPMVLTGADVGSSEGDFGRQAYTDGGVYDNLGVRMFRFLALASGETPLSWDGVIVSDVGKSFEVLSASRAGGLIRTAMRSTEILMDRVWQLENDTFKDVPGFVFARIIDAVEPEEDPTAPHPEIQRQLASVRTDLDRFSELEISSLVRHGYCVARKACRARPELFGTDLPSNPPWDPTDLARTATASSSAVTPSSIGRPREPAVVTRDARSLHGSAVRRIWTTLLDYRDWASYIYVPILVPLLIVAPYLMVKAYDRSKRINQIVESLAQGSRDLEQMSQLMEGPVDPWTGERAEELRADDVLNPKGFQVLQDLRIIDLRKWKPLADRSTDDTHFLYGYRRLKVRKVDDGSGNSHFRTSVLAFSPETQIRFPKQQLKPRLYSRALSATERGEKMVHWEIGTDLRRVPVGEAVDVIYEHMSPGTFLRDGIGSTTLSFGIEMDTVELSRWLLLPEGKEYKSFQIIRYETGKPETAESIQPVTQYLSEDSTILAFKLLSLKGGYTHEISWHYR